jgi:hypothetical protein
MSNRIKLLFSLFLFVFVSACDSGDESPTVSLVGSWSAQSFEANVVAITSAPGVNLTSTSAITATELDYNLTFSETEFTTSGSYTVNNVFSFNGTEQTFVSAVNDVMGSGTYTSTENEIQVSNSFFSLDINGTPLETGSQVQSIPYEITSDNVLVFSQNQTITETNAGVTVEFTIVSTSRWTRD